MKHALLLFVLCLHSIAFSQQIQETNDRIIQTAKNQVAENTIVYTFIYSGFTSSLPDYDWDEIQTLDSEVNSILVAFKAIDGIVECGFDSATGTFTVVTDAQTDLNPVIASINKIEP